MSLQTALYDSLAGHAGLAALVGVRVYPDVAPIGVAAPYVVWNEVGATPMNNMSGDAPSLNNYRVQVVSLGVTALQARNVAVQVRAAMQAASQFKSLEVDFASADFEDGSKIYGARSDYSIWYAQ